MQKREKRNRIELGSSDTKGVTAVTLTITKGYRTVTLKGPGENPAMIWVHVPYVLLQIINPQRACARGLQ